MYSKEQYLNELEIFVGDFKQYSEDAKFVVIDGEFGDFNDGLSANEVEQPEALKKLTWFKNRIEDYDKDDCIKYVLVIVKDNEVLFNGGSEDVDWEDEENVEDEE